MDPASSTDEHLGCGRAQAGRGPSRDRLRKAAGARRAQLKLEPCDADQTALSALGSGFPGRLIFTPNLDHLLLLDRHAAFRRAYALADVLINDSRFLNRLAIRDVALCFSGADLAPYMLDRLSPGAHVFIVGGNDAIQAYLRERFSRLDFTFRIPSMGYIRRRAERRDIVQQILAARPDCVFVCTGAPQSELFAAQLKRAGCDADILCCGAAFHFMAGVVRRAPERFRRLGAEWLWRFAREPHTRKRYVGDIAFLMLRLPAFVQLRLRQDAQFGAFTLGVRSVPAQDVAHDATPAAVQPPDAPVAHTPWSAAHEERIPQPASARG